MLVAFQSAQENIVPSLSSADYARPLQHQRWLVSASDESAIDVDHQVNDQVELGNESYSAYQSSETDYQNHSLPPCSTKPALWCPALSWNAQGKEVAVNERRQPDRTALLDRVDSTELATSQS